MTTESLRILNDPPLPGVTNMACDEALMTLVGAGASPPTLRLYEWDPATISLGYFQKYADYESLEPPARSLPVVRRPTGGGAILHDLELTYSIALPLAHPLMSAGPNHLYELAHDAVISFLAALGAPANRDGHTDDSGPTRGPFFCFARRHKFDVLVGGDKLAGSAQRRTQQAVLQHGSIIVGNRYAQQPTAAVEVDVALAVHRLRSEFPTRLAALTGLHLLPGEWSAEELAEADRHAPKFAGEEWTKRM